MNDIHQICHETPSAGLSVVQSWIVRLPLRMQATLLSALRGCDGRSKHDASKPLTRSLRTLLLNPADPGHLSDPNNTFFAKAALTQDAVDLFLADIDAYPVHWLTHFMHAVEIISYHHPSETTRARWLSIYLAIVDRLHLQPETKEALAVRLRDGRRTPEEECGARARI